MEVDAVAARPNVGRDVNASRSNMVSDVVTSRPNVGLGVDASRSNMEVDAARPNVGLDVDASRSNMEVDAVASKQNSAIHNKNTHSLQYPHYSAAQFNPQ
jgi:hypothetical protein